MSRFRAHSDPSSPSASPSATSSSRLPNPFFSAQIHHPQPHPLASSRPVPRPTQSSQSASRSILLTSEALAALAIAESSASTTPDPSPSPGTGYQNTNWSTRGNEHYDIPRSGHGGGRRRSVTPSTTSVSDGEEEGYEEAQDARSGAKEWMNRKGKDKATERSYSGQGSGMAGSLPEEVLMHIFRQVPPRDLPNMLLVSRTWCLSAFPLLWARPSPTSIPALANLVRVIVTPPESLSLPYPSYIRRVNLSSIASEVTDDLFSPFKICTRMERITMVGATKISALTLRAVVDCMPDLVALDLSNAGNMDDGVLKVIAGRCPRLQGFNLSGCKSVGDEGMKAIAGECKMLRRIKLAGCHRLTDESVTLLARSCPLILEFDLASVPQLRDTSIYATWLNCPHLRELKINNNANLTSTAFPDILQLSTEDDDDARRYNSTWTNLISRLPTTTSNRPGGLLRNPSTRHRASTVDSYIAPTPLPINTTLLRPVADTFDHLRVVDLTACSELRDPAIVNLVKNAPKLRNLTLAKCSKLTDISLEAVAKLGKSLHYLHLGHVDNITDVGISTLARACTRLRYLDVACCALLTDLAIFEIAAYLPKLRRIGLVKVVNLTDEGIYALAERHPSLERIHLSYCDNISVRAITFLLNRLLKLSHLSLTGVSAFKKEELQRFRKAIPPDFNEHQIASFCVYSQAGIIALRNHLNAQQAAQTAGSDTSTRRGSGSSASSVTVPGYDYIPFPAQPPVGGAVWIGPAHGDNYPVYDDNHGWSTAYTMNQDHNPSGLGSSSSNRSITPQTGDQVYRRVSTPSLPTPPSGSRRDRPLPRPRGPRDSAAVGTGTELGAAFASPTPNFLVPTSDSRDHSDRYRGQHLILEDLRVPGEYPDSPSGPNRQPQQSGGSRSDREGSRRGSRETSTSQPHASPSDPNDRYHSRHRSQTTSSSTPPPPPSSYNARGGASNRASTGNIYASSANTPPATPGRERSSSGSSLAGFGLVERLRRPSVGDVGSPLRWVAEMVGWTGEDEGPRGERRSSEPYDPYIPSGSRGGPSAGGAGSLQGQQTGGNKKIQDIQQQIDDTVGIMHENITKVAERGERLDALQDKTDTLAASAQGFRRGANRVRKQMWWKDMRMRIAIGVGIVLLLVVIIVPIVQHFSKPNN